MPLARSSVASVLSSPVAQVSSFFTTFAGTENPVSEGGKWLGGLTDGLDWNDFQSASGRAYAARAGGGVNFDDSVLILKPSAFVAAPAQSVEITIYRAPNYNPDPLAHEIGIFLRGDISAHSMRAYEVYLNSQGNFGIVVWFGPVNSFDYLSVTGPTPGVPVNGDKLRAQIVGNVITVYMNSVLVATATDSGNHWPTGQPGLQSAPQSGVITLASYGMDDFLAVNL